MDFPHVECIISKIFFIQGDNMKIAVLGKGFLGQEFESMGYEVWGRDKFDATNINNLQLIKAFEHVDVIINCIGISDTRYCEDPKNFEEIMHVNGHVPKVLSQYCQATNKKFVHISTGCLYDEIGRPCTEEDFLATHCAYTVSKYVGERGCDTTRDLIMRPRLIFSDKKQTGHNNLIQKLMKFDTFVDEFNSVTWNKTIVEAVQALLDEKQSGIFNVANEGIHTIHEIAQMLGRNGEKISGAELRKSQGLYLVNNVMDISKLRQFYLPPTVSKAISYCRFVFEHGREPV
jgi:dTDP-4-dehydrorhamnose reductase